MTFPTYDQCQSEFDAGNVYRNVSPCGNYVLFNYRPNVEYDNLWNDTNVWCRGIIFDNNTHQIAAVPFRKFWNVGQKPETSEENLSALGKPVVMSKEDGSLGILFWNLYERKWQVATRGSFTSDQAVWATDWIQKQSKLTDEFLSVGETHLFEIVYPENKIVANYNGFEGLIYLNTVVWEVTDNSCYYSFGGAKNEIVQHIQDNCRTVRLYNFSDFAKMREQLSTFTKDDEGFVLQFRDGTMAKMKAPEYLRVHKIRSSLTIENVADLVIATGDFKSALEQLPDEFWGDYLPAITAFEKAVMQTLGSAAVLEINTHGMETRKEKAAYILANCTEDVRRAAFLMIDGKRNAAFESAVKFHTKSNKFHFKTFLGND